MAPPNNGGGSAKVFGQAMKRSKRSGGGGNSNYQRQFGGKGNNNKKNDTVYRSAEGDSNNTDNKAAELAQWRRIKQAKGEALDKAFGTERFAPSLNQQQQHQTTTKPKNMSNNDDEPEQQQQQQEQSRRGWLYNILPTTVTVSSADPGTGTGGPERSAVDLYFCTENSNNNNTSTTFKSTLLYRPYFFLLPDFSSLSDTSTASLEVILELLTSTLLRLFENRLYNVQVVYKLDLDQPNHLSPRHYNTSTSTTSNQADGSSSGGGAGAAGRPMLKLTFDNTHDLMDVRGQLRPMIEQNQKRNSTHDTSSFSASFHDSNGSNGNSSSISSTLQQDPLRLVVDMREYDVPYVMRVCTDMDIRAGTWYTVVLDDDAADNNNNANMEESGGIRLTQPDRESKANPTFLAFDIECTKAPLKFPSADVDEIFMISYMVSSSTSGSGQGGQGYLICSRSVVSADVNDFEYTPKPNYPGPFHIFNEVNEKALLERFFDEYKKHRPQIVVTYNGDFFDWPFVEARAKHHGIDMFERTGVELVNDGGGYRGRTSVHLDAFHWVQRDSYLPQGAQGLKAVTKYKLGYDPVEVDPEDMVRFAQERPVHMATYSVSDAVATFYLYEKYVHLFIFSLCTIIPMGPEDVLCKGSGTLCEALLMVQACTKSIICPNKQVDPLAKFHKGHLLESETYIGGKVECLETGVYRSDVEYEFDLKPTAFQQLIDNIDRDLTFAIEVEGGLNRRDISNYDEIRSEIIEELEMLRDRPKRFEKPYIYHLDVGAMYPNIILTNRLQPSSIVDDATCAACDFNQSKNNCKRRMNWTWRGDYNPATRNEYEHTKNQLSREAVKDGTSTNFNQLSEKDQANLVSTRLKTYAKNAYKKTKITEEENREDVVCMRENDFYVDTVRQFRDRRYEFKKLNNSWKKKLGQAKDPTTKKQCEDKVLVYDSLQVAHKCILNSFYGYVMRKGARWRSMEMAGIVTKTGSDIITQARILVEQIGRPLELDTDGIWCILPKSFPDVYTFLTKDGSKLKLEYPCVMLNADVHDHFPNNQYQTLVDPSRGLYETHSECSIFFEVDGPYRCMVLPASTEEGKLLKKRYAVFNFDGSLAELKGFELKRRGELELIKTFQSQVFERFLDGNSLKECYDCVAEVANHWIDVIDTRGDSLDDEELVDLISENRSMSRQLEDYGGQKGTSQTTARRLGEFLGAEIIKDKGLNCKFIIAEQPYGAPVTERAIPTAIWKAEPSVTKHFLRKWMKSPGLDGDAMDIRNVLDWDYYMERLSNTVRKIITIPAALQKIPNPVPRVQHPDWLTSKVNQLNDKFKQQTITGMFQAASAKPAKAAAVDMEDIGSSTGKMAKRPLVHSSKRTPRISSLTGEAQQVSSETRVTLSKENFSVWLEQKKSGWRRSRRERRSLTLRDGSGVSKRQKKAVSVEGFLRDAALSLEQKEWHIIEMREMTGYDAVSPGQPSSGSGEFIVWVMVGGDSLRKINITVPRTVYLSTHAEVTTDSTDILEFKRVDKHLPHNKAAAFVYEISMPEYVYKTSNWIKSIHPVSREISSNKIFDTLFESASPLRSRLLAEIGSLARLKPAGDRAKSRKTYSMTELARIERPSEGEYLDFKTLAYKRVVLYVRIDPRLKTGVVAVYSVNGGSGKFAQNSEDSWDDLTRPSAATAGSFDVGASCRIWIVKPGSSIAGQRGVSLRQCTTRFSELIETIQKSAGLDSEYACVSPESRVQISALNFVDSEAIAFAGANETISSQQKSGNGATFLLVNSTKSTMQLRRHLSSLGSMPVVWMPFPPGPAHNPSLSTLPPLNWELPAVQLCLEAYLFMQVISFPKRVAYSRYGHVPLGNLDGDENAVLYEVGLTRIMQKNRTLSWASPVAGRPDLGVEFLPSAQGGMFPIVSGDTLLMSQEEIWGDDDELVSPNIRRPGCYRSVCVDIDVQDLAIAALTDASGSMPSAPSGPAGTTAANSPNSVTMFDSRSDLNKSAAPLGDEMATSVSLSILRSLITGWLRDAFNSNSVIADELLHHIYRLVSSQDSLLHDPALHRVVHSLMKTTFHRMLGELHRLGCSVVHASFHRIIVATNKLELADAEEYINFIIFTARKGAASADQGDALSKVSLRPRQFHSHFLFLDEHNFGTMYLERVPKEQVDPEDVSNVIPETDNESTVVLPSVVTGWSIMNYLGSQTAQSYFRAIIGRFSKDPFQKQMELVARGGDLPLVGSGSAEEELLEYRKKFVSKHLASYLTRAVGEIVKDGFDESTLPAHVVTTTTRMAFQNPALEFIKNIIEVLQLDAQVDSQVQVLKRSLLSQISVAEYSRAAQWVNPCPTFILPDVFCTECHESRDVNLFYMPPLEDDENGGGTPSCWACEDCGVPYNVHVMEQRLIALLYRKLVRYQLQDVRCKKTNRVAARCLAPLSDCSAGIKLDTNPNDAIADVQLLHGLGKLHELDDLKNLTEDVLKGFR